MITSKQLEILGRIGKNIFLGYTFNDIMRLSNEKSNSGIQRAIKEFLDEKIIIIKKFGNANVYYLNLENPKIFDYLGIYYKEKDFANSINQDISNIINEISQKDAFAVVVIFGSYAIDKNKKNSDLDIAIIVKNDKSNIKIAISNIHKKCLNDIHPEIFDEQEFLEMLRANYENVGKEITRKGLAIYNTTIFYKIIKKGIENGFKG